VTPGAGVGRPATGFESVSWLELFYDLVMVAAIIVFAHAISIDPHWPTVLRTAVMFSLLWWVWLSTTLLVNVDPRAGALRRAVVFAQMLTVVLLIIVAAHAPTLWQVPLSPLIGVLLLLAALAHELTRRTRPDLVPFAGRRRNELLLAGVLIAVTGVAPDALALAFWLVAAVVLVAPVLTHRFDRGLPESGHDAGHLAERVTALTTIVLGETFIRVALSGAERHLYEINFVVVTLEFVVVFAVWIAYMDQIGRRGLPLGSLAQRWWTVAHLPLHLGIIGAAVGMGAFATLRRTADLTEGDIWIMTVPLALTFVSLAVLGLLGPRPLRTGAFVVYLVVAALLVAVAEVTWWSPQVTILEGTAGFGVVAAGGVLVSWALDRRARVPGAEFEAEPLRPPATG
jgi:low temperature requirement protein LtrA